MNSTTSIWGAVVVVAIIALGAYIYPKVNYGMLRVDGTEVQKMVSQEVSKISLGAQSEQVTEGACFYFQGAHICASTKVMSSASTTCSFLSPPATSSVEAFATFTNTFGGSFSVEWGKAVNAFSTTTSLGYKAAAIVSGDQGTFVASSTGSTLVSGEDPIAIVAPNTYVNFKVGSSSPTLTGRCNATFVY